MKKSYTQNLENLTKKIEEMQSLQMHIIAGLHVVIKNTPTSGVRREWINNTIEILEKKFKKVKEDKEDDTGWSEFK